MTDIVGAMTERLLVDAGISAGMRVLDVGCGRGDVSFLIARLVGECGEVVGVDRASRPLAVARAKARELGLTTVSYVESDLHALGEEYRDFDAVVGRRVLMYQSAPIDSVRCVARSLRPGGLLVFQEHDLTMPPTSIASLPLHRRVHTWVRELLEAEGTNPSMGFGLAALLDAAGLTQVTVRAEAIVQTPNTHYAVGSIMRMLLRRAGQVGIVREAEVDVDTLDERLARERAEANATYVGEMVFGAWARSPRSHASSRNPVR